MLSLRAFGLPAGVLSWDCLRAGRGCLRACLGVNEGGRGVNEGGRGVNERVGFCKKECCHYSLVSLVAYFS